MPSSLPPIKCRTYQQPLFAERSPTLASVTGRMSRGGTNLTRRGSDEKVCNNLPARHVYQSNNDVLTPSRSSVLQRSNKVQHIAGNLSPTSVFLYSCTRTSYASKRVRRTPWSGGRLLCWWSTPRDVSVLARRRRAYHSGYGQYVAQAQRLVGGTGGPVVQP